MTLYLSDWRDEPVNLSHCLALPMICENMSTRNQLIRLHTHPVYHPSCRYIFPPLFVLSFICSLPCFVSKTERKIEKKLKETTSCHDSDAGMITLPNTYCGRYSLLRHIFFPFPNWASTAECQGPLPQPTSYHVSCPGLPLLSWLSSLWMYSLVLCSFGLWFAAKESYKAQPEGALPQEHGCISIWGWICMNISSYIYICAHTLRVCMNKT